MDLIINDGEIFNAIFDDSNHDSLFELNIILNISQPIILELNNNDEKYLIYVLRDYSKVNDDRVIAVQELLFSKANDDIVSKLIKSEISIYDAFLTSHEIWRVGRVGGKIFPRKTLENIRDIEDRFPIQDLKLKDIPNRAF
ncbi:hypothetical protein [Bacillus thuringiensis]|uniref:hypothetical protein n=1 Tax=Bacillus thuringiensis TaxID=1428 RepID=UPI0021D64930|nr:hypothetical protein [Bacillus thuringiensis]MCU7667661.1 hypothetical protein [Bacillus thuringiensis]